MSVWLQAAKSASTLKDKTDKTDKTPEESASTPQKSGGAEVLSEGGIPVSPASSDISDPAPASVTGENASERTYTTKHGTQAEPRSDPEFYAEALRLHGPTSYGVIGVLLGWGMTRAATAETALRGAGRIQYDNAGMGRLIEAPEGEKS